MAQSSDGVLISTLDAYRACEATHHALVDDVGGIVSEFHEQFVPAFAADALERLYGSLYASYIHARLSDSAQPIPHTWVGYQHGEVVGVLLFRVRFDQVLVATEMFHLEQTIADAFCRALFDRYRQVHAVLFNAVSLPRALTGWSLQYYPFSENYVISLPNDMDGYLHALGKSTRKTLRGYGNRLQRDLPDLIWEVRQADALRSDQLRALIRRLQQFKRDSMAARGKRAELSRRDMARILILCRRSGLVGIARMGDQICGGSLACRIGDNYVMLFSASDPALASYRLGILCCFWSVCDCIRAGGRECHLLWGRYQYKTQLLGEPHPLLRLVIYRSIWRRYLSPITVISMWFAACRYRVRDWLLNRFSAQSWLGSQSFPRLRRFVTWVAGWRTAMAKATHGHGLD
ncbi:MAG: GNAT family N-acetyltransferase [Burkholderiaceae bacterium]